MAKPTRGDRLQGSGIERSVRHWHSAERRWPEPIYYGKSEGTTIQIDCQVLPEAGVGTVASHMRSH